MYPQSGLWRCGDAVVHHISTFGAVAMWRMCDKSLTDLHVHMP